MEKYFYSFIIGCCISNLSYSQEIIAFPDLSENHEAVYNGDSAIDDRNYALYTQDYQKALLELDSQIDQIKTHLRQENSEESIKLFHDKKAQLLRKKAALLDEAELAEDLNKFY